MSGLPPVVSIALDAASYKPGFTMIATATITDPDTTAERLTSTDALGRVVILDVTRTDEAAIVWRWQGGAEVAAGVNPAAIIAPATSMVLECQVTDNQGNITVASVPVIVVQPPLLRVGICCPPTQRTVHASLFPGAAWMSAYGPPGSGVPSWRGLHTIPDGVLPWVRFKDRPTAELLNPWLDGIPDGLDEVFLTFHHEVKVSDDPAQFRADWVALRQIVDAHPHGRKVRLVLIYGNWQLRYKGMAWRDYWPLMPDGSPAAHGVGVDTYQHVDAATYTDPADLLAEAVTIGQAAGLPWYVPEFGALRVAGDTDGSGRAAFIASSVAYLATVGCSGVAWWCSLDQTYGDFHLDGDPPGVRAWTKAISDRGA